MQDLSVTIFQQDLAWQDAPANRAQFADVTAEVLEEFLRAHWGLRLQP